MFMCLGMSSYLEGVENDGSREVTADHTLDKFAVWHLVDVQTQTSWVDVAIAVAHFYF